jgi:hypothetical protein
MGSTTRGCQGISIKRCWVSRGCVLREGVGGLRCLRDMSCAETTAVTTPGLQGCLGPTPAPNPQNSPHMSHTARSPGRKGEETLKPLHVSEPGCRAARRWLSAAASGVEEGSRPDRHISTWPTCNRGRGRGGGGTGEGGGNRHTLPVSTRRGR